MVQLPDEASVDVTNARYFAARHVGADVARAQALVTHAWLPFARYLARGVIDDLDLDTYCDAYTVEPDIVAAFTDAVAADSEETPLYPIAHSPSRLDPGGRHSMAEVGELAIALAACLPAVYLALLDGTVPEAVGSGEIYESRAALADLYLDYATSDPRHAGGHPDLVTRALTTPPAANAPIELTDRWRWFVYVYGGDSTMPFRCFRSLPDATKYALLQTDHTRACAGLHRNDRRFQSAAAALQSCPADGVMVEVLGSDYKTAIKPLDRRPLPVHLASASWWLPAPLS